MRSSNLNISSDFSSALRGGSISKESNIYFLTPFLLMLASSCSLFKDKKPTDAQLTTAIQNSTPQQQAAAIRLADQMPAEQRKKFADYIQANNPAVAKKIEKMYPKEVKKYADTPAEAQPVSTNFRDVPRTQRQMGRSR